MEQIRPDQPQRTHSATSMWGSILFPRACSSLFHWNKDPVWVGEKCYECELGGLFPQRSPKPTFFSIWDDAQSYGGAIMHHHEVVVSGAGPCSSTSASCRVAFPIHRVSSQEYNLLLETLTSALPEYKTNYSAIYSLWGWNIAVLRALASENSSELAYISY